MHCSFHSIKPPSLCSGVARASSSRCHSKVRNSGPPLCGREAEVLDSFWYSRGIVDDTMRDRVVSLSLEESVDRDLATAVSGGEQTDAGVGKGSVSSVGVSSTWAMEAQGENGSLPEEVLWASQRILDLYRFLGSREDVDVVWMVQREPQLLQTSVRALTARLLELRIDDAAQGVDVAKLAESQPSLLLDEGCIVDEGESTDKKLEAWKHGLLGGDGVNEWNKHVSELEEYRKRHGDAHVGFRDGDPQHLKRWCRKQRQEYSRGELSEERKEKLLEIGFEFNDEEAEWMRWYREYLVQQADSSTANLTKPADFYLINWCAIQRIAKRSRVLPEHRQQLLDEAGFDWNQPDALS